MPTWVIPTLWKYLNENSTQSFCVFSICKGKLNKTSCFQPALNLWIRQAYLGYLISPELQSCSVKGMARPWEEHPKQVAHPSWQLLHLYSTSLIFSVISQFPFLWSAATQLNISLCSLSLSSSINLFFPLRGGCVFCNIKTLQFPGECMNIEVGGLMTKLLLSHFDNKIAVLL